MTTMKVNEFIAALIDRGADVDTSIKNLTVEDKGIKAKLMTDLVVALPNEGSVQFLGNVAAMVVTASEKVSLDTKSEAYPKLQEAVRNGLLIDAVTERLSLVVPPAETIRAAEILRQAGIRACVNVSLEVKAADVRKMRTAAVRSPEEGEARQALETCLESEISHRVKYGAKE